MTNRPRNDVTRLAVIVMAAAGLATACATARPEVLTTTPDEVAIEFPKAGDLGEATDLAQKECAKYERTARFTVVKTAATPTTRVAKFRCVSIDDEPDVAAPPPVDAQAAQDAAAQAATDAGAQAEAAATDAAAQGAAAGTEAANSAADAATSAADQTTP